MRTVKIFLCLIIEIPRAPQILDAKYLFITTTAETSSLVTLNLRMPSNADRFDLKHFTVRSSALVPTGHQSSELAVNVTLVQGSTNLYTLGSTRISFPKAYLNLNEILTVTAVSKCSQEGKPSPPSSASKLVLSERGEMQTSVYTINNYSSYLFLQLPLFLPVLICLISVVSSYNIIIHTSTLIYIHGIVSPT